MQKQNLCQGDFMPKNRQHYRKIKYPDKVTKQNALYLSGYFYLVLWEVEMLISRQPLLFLSAYNHLTNLISLTREFLFILGHYISFTLTFGVEIKTAKIKLPL